MLYGATICTNGLQTLWLLPDANERTSYLVTLAKRPPFSRGRVWIVRRETETIREPQGLASTSLQEFIRHALQSVNWRSAQAFRREGLSLSDVG